MPTYCFTNFLDGHTVERVYPIRKIPKRIAVNGRWYERDIVAEHREFRDTPGNYPRYSPGMAVHPSQIAEVNAFCERNGVPTEHNSRGQPKLTSPDHEFKYMRARGFCHWNAGYSDAAPTFKKKEKGSNVG